MSPCGDADRQTGKDVASPSAPAHRLPESHPRPITAPTPGQVLSRRVDHPGCVAEQKPQWKDLGDGLGVVGVFDLGT